MDLHPPTLAAARYIMDNARDRDRLEVRAVVGIWDAAETARGIVGDWVDRGAWGGVFCLDDTPIAILTAVRETPKSLQVGLIATDRFNEIALPVTRYVRHYVGPELRKADYKRAECRCWEGHEDARRWLAICGAKQEAVIPAYGAHGETFIQMAWK